jgi:hypothetical protein
MVGSLIVDIRACHGASLIFGDAIRNGRALQNNAPRVRHDVGNRLAALKRTPGYATRSASITDGNLTATTWQHREFYIQHLRVRQRAIAKPVGL